MSGDAVSPADAKEPIDVSGCVVVTIDQLGGSLVHHEPAAQLADQSGRHTDVIQVQIEMTSVCTADSSRPSRRNPSRIASRPGSQSVPQSRGDPPIRLDGVGVDPGRALEGEWGRDQVDPVAQ